MPTILSVSDKLFIDWNKTQIINFAFVSQSYFLIFIVFEYSLSGFALALKSIDVSIAYAVSYAYIKKEKMNTTIIIILI